MDLLVLPAFGTSVNQNQLCSLSYLLYAHLNLVKYSAQSHRVRCAAFVRSVAGVQRLASAVSL